jgi:hypothetical protein
VRVEIVEVETISRFYNALGVCGYVDVTWTPMLITASFLVSSVGMSTCVYEETSGDDCGRGREKKALAGPFVVCVICPA